MLAPRRGANVCWQRKRYLHAVNWNQLRYVVGWIMFPFVGVLLTQPEFWQRRLDMNQPGGPGRTSCWQEDVQRPRCRMVSREALSSRECDTGVIMVRTVYYDDKSLNGYIFSIFATGNSPWARFATIQLKTWLQGCRGGHHRAQQLAMISLSQTLRVQCRTAVASCY